MPISWENNHCESSTGKAMRSDPAIILDTHKPTPTKNSCELDVTNTSSGEHQVRTSSEPRAEFSQDVDSTENEILSLLTQNNL